jgi:hypothetical protein
MGHRHIGQSVIVVMVAFLARVAVAVDDNEALLPAAEELIASSFLCVVYVGHPANATDHKTNWRVVGIILASTFPAHDGRNSYIIVRIYDTSYIMMFCV